MRLLEAILEANHRADGDPARVELNRAEFAPSLPLVALTCIDPRLNARLPAALGLGVEDFVWLRNAGNIIFDPLSAMTRSLALAGALKGGKEIAILGHSDCRVGQTNVMDLTERFRALGVDRSRLPDNLTEFFGLFASERQNVRQSVDMVRRSPLIGAQTPVHGLLLDLASNQLEWIVNGYEHLGTPAPAPVAAESLLNSVAVLTGLNLGAIKLPATRIGDVVTKLATVANALGTPASSAPAGTAASQTAPATAPGATSSPAAIKVHPRLRYRIVGSDNKVYGPVTGARILEWLTDGRIDAQTQAQREDDSEWKSLAAFDDLARSARIPIPPNVQQVLRKLRLKR